MKKVQCDSISKKTVRDLEIVHVPGPNFTPEELDLIADLVAGMILDHHHAKMKHQNQTSHKNDTLPKR